MKIQQILKEHPEKQQEIQIDTSSTNKNSNLSTETKVNTI